MLRHDQLALLQSTSRVAVEGTAYRIVTAQPDSLCLPVIMPGEKGARSPAVALGKLCPPEALQFRTRRRVANRTIARKTVRQHPHVAHTLQIVVVGEGEDPSPFFADLPG